MGLTKKEIECAVYVKKGFQIKEIAARMCISPRTIEKHIASIKQKLRIKNTKALIVFLGNFL